MRFIVFLVISISLMGFTDTRAQDLSNTSIKRDAYVVQQWNNSNGLPVNSISNAIRGEDGYLWISTFDGLVRFDGKNFTTFKPKTGRRTAAISNRFMNLVEAGNGEILLHTGQGQLVLFKKGKFQLLIPDESFSTSVVNHISKGVENNTIIATNDGIWNYKNGKLSRVYPNLVKDNILIAIQITENDFWYEGLRSRVGRILNGGVSTIALAPRNQNSKLRFSLVPASETYYLIWQNFLYRVNGENISRIELFSNKSIILNDLHYIDGKVYLSSESHGFFIYHTESGELEKLPKPTGRTAHGNTIETTSTGDVLLSFYNALSVGANEFIFTPEDDYIATFKIDKNDNIWVISSNKGIFLLKKNKFETFTHQDGLINRNTYPITEKSNGTIVAGSFGDFITKIDPDGNTESLIQPYSFKAGAYTLSLLESYDNRFYVGSYMDGLHEVVDDRYQSIRFTSYDNLSVYALYEDTKKNIWIGTDKGVFLKSPDENWNNVGFIPIPTTRTIRTFKESPDGSMFMATNGDGLYYINQGEVKHIDINDGLSSNFVRDIYIDSVSYGKTQRILVTTENNGLNHIEFDDNQKPEITLITEDDGLYSNGNHQIFKDEFGRFWFGANNGIYWIPESELWDFVQGKRTSISSIAYTEKDGLNNREVNGGIQPAGTIDRNGNIWFPTQGGPLKVDPGKIELVESKLPVKIESIKSTDSLYQFLPENLTLSKHHRTLRFKYTSLSIRNAENVRFRYRLPPVQKEWIYAHDRRDALFSNLPDGDITFQVQASINGQNWGANQASVSIFIPGYWYEFWWVKVLGFLLFAGISGSGFYMKYRERAKLENKLKMALQKYQNDTTSLKRTLLKQNRNLKKQFEKQQESVKEEYLAYRKSYSHLLRVLSDNLHISNLDKTNRKEIILGIFQLRFAFYNFVNHRMDLYPDDFDQQWKMDKINLNSVLLPFGQQIREWTDHTNTSADIDFKNESKLIIETDPVLFEMAMFGLFYLLKQHTPSDKTIKFQLMTKPDEVIIKLSTPARHVSPAPDVLLDRITDYISFLRPVNTHISAFDTTNELVIDATFPIVESEIYTTSETELSSKEANMLSTSAHIRDEDTPEKATILIIDDELITRTFLEKVLSPYYEVISLDDPTKVLDIITDQPPSFIITDYYMPAMSGIELISTLKEIDLNVPLILLTGATEDAIHSNSLRAGADIVLHKPVNASILLEQISTLFRKHYLSKQNINDSYSYPDENKNYDILHYDDPFIDKLSIILEKHYFESELSVETLAEQLYLDRSQLYRKLKKITGLSPTGVVQEFRLNKARQMITESDLNVSEVALATGFNSLSYFSRRYKEKFGESPSKTTTTKNT